jgi:hypothetical protein
MCLMLRTRKICYQCFELEIISINSTIVAKQKFTNISSKNWKERFLFKKTSVSGKLILTKAIKSLGVYDALSDFLYSEGGKDWAEQREKFESDKLAWDAAKEARNRERLIREWLVEFDEEPGENHVFDDWFGEYIRDGKLGDAKTWMELAFRYLE